MHPVNCLLQLCVLLQQVLILKFQLFISGLQLGDGGAAVGLLALLGDALYDRRLRNYITGYLIGNELITHVIIHIHKALVRHGKDGHGRLAHRTDRILRNLIKAIPAASGTIVNS